MKLSQLLSDASRTDLTNTDVLSTKLTLNLTHYCFWTLSLSLWAFSHWHAVNPTRERERRESLEDFQTDPLLHPTFFQNKTPKKGTIAKVTPTPRPINVKNYRRQLLHSISISVIATMNILPSCTIGILMCPISSYITIQLWGMGYLWQNWC